MFSVFLIIEKLLGNGDSNGWDNIVIMSSITQL